MGRGSKDEDFRQTTDRCGIVWLDDVRPPERKTQVDWGQVQIPGAIANCAYDDLRRILGSIWRLASWLPRTAIVTTHSDGWRVHRLIDPGEEIPEGAEVVEWDHDHCEVSFCGVQICAPWNEQLKADPRPDLGYTDGGGSWLCRQCGEAVLKHWDVLAAGLRARGHEGEPVEFGPRTLGERHFPPY